MIQRLYNPWHITNSGEREADRHFVLPAGKENDPCSIIYSLRISSRYHKIQMAGECDFVILMPAGIIVVEVKGGVIGHGKADDGDHGFYRVTDSEGKESIKNPFIQANANADAVMRYLKEKGIADVFIAHMVCFPECIFKGEVIGSQYLWHRGIKNGLLEMAVVALEEQISAFYEKHSYKNTTLQDRWHTLDEIQIQKITDLLSPEFEPRRYQTRALLNHEESQRRIGEGLHILRGLGENRRIMVQGPPGSGKSTYAVDIILHLCKNEGKKGLYLCWNELLAASMNERLHHADAEIPEGSITVRSYFHFLQDLAAIAGKKALIPTHEMVSRGEIQQLAKETLNRLHKMGKLPKYDFLVADEAQDLFDKGIDQVIKSTLKVNNPLQHGNYYVFFDDSQVYPRSEDLNNYMRTRDTLKESSAYYVLYSSLRANTGHGIPDLIKDAGNGFLAPEKGYGEDTTFVSWKDAKDLPNLLYRFALQERTLSHCGQSDIIILFTADLLKEGSLVSESLAQDPRFQFLDKDNLAIPSDKLYYTTALKSKGLEWEVVLLVTSNILEGKTFFQVFIGASRAKRKLFAFTKD